MVDVLYLTAAETKGLVTGEDALALAEQVARWQAADQVTWPEPRVFLMQMKPQSFRFRIKMGGLTDVPVAGVRVTGYHLAEDGSGTDVPDNTRFVILSDPDTGHPLAIIDEHFTYNLRSCAAGILALKVLARPDSKVVGMIGAGGFAATLLELLRLVFPYTEVRVNSRRPESREDFARRMTERLGVPVVARETVRETIDGADIVLTATSAHRNLVYDGWLDEGATICSLGGWEVDPALMRSADKFVVSDWEIFQDLADGRELVKSGEIKTTDVYSDVATIISGKKPGRQSPRERIVIRAGGLVVQDVMMCYHVYRLAREKGIGTWLKVAE